MAGMTEATAVPTHTLIDSHSDTEQQIGYCRAVIESDWIFISGTTGFDYAHKRISDDIAEQAEQCVRNIRHVLEKAGSRLEDVVRVIYVIPHAGDIEGACAVLRKHFGAIRPACMLITAGLVDPRMRLEIQTTALRGSGSRPREVLQITLGPGD
jgi:enamine deaminase RidA (YjgF/YER057c/UK114 family)